MKKDIDVKELIGAMDELEKEKGVSLKISNEVSNEVSNEELKDENTDFSFLSKINKSGGLAGKET